MSTGILDGVKSWMSFEGWTDGGNPGSVKKDQHGNIIARHGDATWVTDVEACCDREVAAKAREELERRGVIPSHVPSSERE